LAGKGIGLYTSVKDAVSSLVKIEKTFSPNKENSEVYEKAYQNWRAAYPSFLQLSDSKITRHMWCAPGL
jgi:autoinducer 2 (AI-2) kinase